MYKCVWSSGPYTQTATQQPCQHSHSHFATDAAPATAHLRGIGKYAAEEST